MYNVGIKSKSLISLYHKCWIIYKPHHRDREDCLNNISLHMITSWHGNISLITGPSWGESTGHRSSWWRHQMETFSALLTICAGNSPVPGEFPTQRPVSRSFDIFFDLSLNKRLSKQSWGWWFETLSRPLWRHCNVHFPKGLYGRNLMFPWLINGTEQAFEQAV